MLRMNHSFALGRLWKCQAGSALPVMASTLMVLLAAAGAAVDIGRIQMVQSKLSSSLDAAGLAAGSTVSTANLETELAKYMNGNFQGYLGSTLNGVNAVVNNDNTLITLSASATLPMTFMQIFGMDEVTLSASAEITRASKGLELVLVLDNTGSMYGSPLASLKTAATDLVNILYGDSETVENLWVGLVPFAQAVNIGSSRTSWVSAGSFNWGTTSWMGCVDAREASGRDTTDDPPSVELFPKYYWPCHTSYNAWYGTNSSRSNCSTSGTIRYKSGLGTSLGPNKSCSQAVTPMTASKTTVLNAINAMTADGYTHINLGAVWGWRMLSPRWQGLWGGEMDANSLPLDYNTENMNKAVIIMTDGDNTMSSSVHGAYGYPSEGRLGTTSSSVAAGELDERLLEVCTSMKDNNIIVYTIAFGSVSSSSQTMLESCATQESYFFYSPSSAELQTAFRAIGDSLANLRVSK